MRRDAAANRERLIDVARAALERDETPPLTSIARAAGVGQGTLYRHFPTWPDLVLAVHRTDVDALVAAAPGLRAALPPVEALRAWLDMLADYGHLKRGLLAALYSDLHERLAAEQTAGVVAALDGLLAAGRAAGALRSDLDGADVLQLVGFLWRLPAGEDRGQRAERLLDAVVAGLRADVPAQRGAIP